MDNTICGAGCLDIIEAGDVTSVKLMECKHLFHMNCIMEWFHTCKNNTCPLCRQVSTKIVNFDGSTLNLPNNEDIDSDSIYSDDSSNETDDTEEFYDIADNFQLTNRILDNRVSNEIDALILKARQSQIQHAEHIFRNNQQNKRPIKINNKSSNKRSKKSSNFLSEMEDLIDSRSSIPSKPLNNKRNKYVSVDTYNIFFSKLISITNEKNVDNMETFCREIYTTLCLCNNKSVLKELVHNNIFDYLYKYILPINNGTTKKFLACKSREMILRSIHYIFQVVQTNNNKHLKQIIRMCININEKYPNEYHGLIPTLANKFKGIL